MEYSSYTLQGDNSQDDTATANELLKRVNLPPVADLSECTSSVFVALCEGILGDPLPGVIYSPVTQEDEIHNVQLVVDHLADKVLHCDLSHITGQAVVGGDRVSVQYLMEILLGVMDYIMEGIDSEGSTTDNDDLLDPDAMTKGTVSAITDVLREELGRRGRENDYRPQIPAEQDHQSHDSQTISDISKHLSQPNTQSEGDSTAELISLGVRDVPHKPQGTTEPERNIPEESVPTRPSIHNLKAHQSQSGSHLQSPRRVGAGVPESTTVSPGKHNDDITVQDLSGSSFSSVSWPKPPPPSASKHQPPSEFDSLGVRPRPALTKDRLDHDDGYERSDSLAGSLRESGTLRQHHVHTHHHYHQSVKRKPAVSAVRSKSPPPATVSQPPTTAESSLAKYSPSKHFKTLRPPAASSWHDRLTDQDDVVLDSSHFRPRHTHLDTLRSTYPDPSRSQPSTSTSTIGADGYPPPQRRGNVYSYEAEDQRDTIPRQSEEEILPPRPRRVAFLDKQEEREQPQRSFRKTARPDVSHFRHDSSDSDVDSDQDVLSQCSDTVVDYQGESNYPKSTLLDDRRYVSTREEPMDHHSYDLRPSKRPASAVEHLRPPVRKHHPERRPKSILLPVPCSQGHRVRFEEALEEDAAGPMSRIRKKLHKENRKHSRQKEVLRYVYKSNLDEAKTGLSKQLERSKQFLDKQDADYRRVFSSAKKTKYQPALKYSTKVTTDRISRPERRGPTAKRKRSASASPTVHRHKKLSIGDDEMLPTVMQEFPFLHVSPQTAHDMWSKQMRQMEQLTRLGVDQQFKKTKTQLKMEEAERRQEILLRIMKKELAHNQRMREIRERRSNEQALQQRVQEQRQVNARARRYYDEFQLRSRSRMIKRRTREEQIFKKLFEDGLKIQKARIGDLRKYAREKREESAKRQQDEIDSLENYYRDQFSMLAETIAKERYELQTRDRAQAKVMDQMKRDMRCKMEHEVRDFQEQMYREEESEYFRQIEADRMRRDLQMASYSTTL